jgi:hypothetical protein
MKLHYQLLCKTYFYYLVLIQIYWITCYVGSLASGPDRSSKVERRHLPISTMNMKHSRLFEFSKLKFAG